MTELAGPARTGTIAVIHERGTATGGRLGLATRNAAGSVRWSLARVWEPAPGADPRRMVWIMLNPSVATHERDDATIRRCLGYAEREGCNSLAVVNLVPVVFTDPDAMLATLPAPGRAWWQDQNLDSIRAAVLHTDTDPLVVLGWGALGTRPEIAGYRAAVLGFLGRAGITPRALGVTASGEPVHPLRQPADAACAPLIPWRPR